MEFPRDLFRKEAVALASSENEKLSKEFMRVCQDYIDELNAKGLPVIFSLDHFAHLVDKEVQEVKAIIWNRRNNYSYYLIRKKRGGYRRIIAPRGNLKQLQWWIKEYILDKVRIHPQVTGFVKGKSIFHNASVHQGQEVILNLDLVDFFESITEKRVYGVFKSLGYVGNVAVDLAKICTARISQTRYETLSTEEQTYFSDLLRNKKNILIQGAPTSPAISNLVCRKLDNRLSKLAISYGVNYSRYADDITFSGKYDNLPPVTLIWKIIREEGFRLNWNKVGLYKAGRKQMVTGLLVDGKVRIPKKYKKEIYRHLYFCKKYGAKGHFDRIAPDKRYRKEWLLGKIYFVRMIEPEEATKMLKLVNDIDWEI